MIETAPLIHLRLLAKSEACGWLSEADSEQEGSDLHGPQGHLPRGGVFERLQQGLLT